MDIRLCSVTLSITPDVMKLIGPPLDDPSWQFYFFCPPSFPPFLKETDTFISSFFRRGNVPKCVRSPPAAGIIRVVSPQKSFSLPNLIIIREQYVNCRWCSSSALQWVDFVFFQSVESVPVFFLYSVVGRASDHVPSITIYFYGDDNVSGSSLRPIGPPRPAV